MRDITFASANSIASAIRERRVSSRDVVEAHLRRIEAINPKLNAIAVLAAEAEEERRTVAQSRLEGLWELG